jgi:hypothetical protein
MKAPKIEDKVKYMKSINARIRAEGLRFSDKAVQKLIVNRLVEEELFLFSPGTNLKKNSTL